VTNRRPLRQGANLTEGGAHFRVWAPRASGVTVRIRHKHDLRCAELPREDGGEFTAFVEGIVAGDTYVYRLSGGAAGLPDPASRFQPDGVHGWSAVVDPGSFTWSDGEWFGREIADLVIYEIHIGTFTQEGTFDAALRHLRELRALGITAIEIMPVAQFPGMRNWGYDDVFPYAVQNSYGGPEGLRRLVNAAHRVGLAVILDVVYNHLGPEGNYLPQFGPYFTDRYRTPWGQAINFDGPESDRVREYFVENALYWIDEYHIDGLRLDAVHAICDFSAVHILEEIADRVHDLGLSLGRQTLVIAESDLNDPRLVRSKERGGYGLDAAWNDDFHHAVHAALTGEREGYYADFGGVDAIATAMQDRFVFAGDYSAYRRRRHGAPAGDIAAERFVVCIQNHDQVGNRACGERLSAIVSFERLKVAAAMNLLAPCVPLLFMGEEYGETNPFLYFVDHQDPELLQAVRKGRQAEFASFGWATEVPDPGSPDTFQRSRLDRTRAVAGQHAQLLAMYRELLSLRRALPALRPGAAEVKAVFDEAASWIAWTLTTATDALLTAFNLSERAVRPTVSVPPGAWRNVFGTEDRRFGGGRGLCPASTDEGGRLSVDLPPTSGSLFRREVG